MVVGECYIDGFMDGKALLGTLSSNWQCVRRYFVVELRLVTTAPACTSVLSLSFNIRELSFFLLRSSIRPSFFIRNPSLTPS